ncbi:MAG: class I SAM-dependent methyltransferase [Deltaproteobacteria bacterium]|nr:class I SAM-dependent methyltransferase [Deltaproteobacteria bacterium]
MEAIKYPSATVRKETLHTLSLVTRYLRPNMHVLDVGCGAGYVSGEMARRPGIDVQSVDIVDCREVRTFPFKIFDGVSLPFAAASFDFVLLSFVLHHVPDERKIPLLREVIRVSRAIVGLVEDTPESSFDYFVGHRHAERFRRRIHSTAGYGFLTRGEWLWLLRGLGLRILEAQALGRFCRSLVQPFARTLMIAAR